MKTILLITALAVCSVAFCQKKQEKSLKDSVKDMQKLTEKLMKKKKINQVSKKDTTFVSKQSGCNNQAKLNK